MSKPVKALDGNGDGSSSSNNNKYVPVATSTMPVAGPSAPPRNEHMWGRNTTTQTATSTTHDLEEALAPPPADDDNEVRQCRICLDTDDPETMIAPCQCTGSSKWVHRACLDEWRVHEHDRAFSACTTCQYPYHFVPVPHHKLKLKARFCWFVSRDLCLVTTAVQAAICFLAWIVWLVDQANGQVLLHVFVGSTSFGCGIDEYDDNNYNSDSSGAAAPSWWCRHSLLAVYYTCGLLVLLVGLGIFGSVFLCNNNCQIPDLDSFQNDAQGTSGTTTSTGGRFTVVRDAPAQPQQQQQSHSYYPDNSNYYRESDTQYVQHQETSTTAATTREVVHDDRTEFYRRRRYNRRRRGGGGSWNCCLPRYGYYPYYPSYGYGYRPYYYYYGTPGDADCCCCCLDCCANSSSSSNADCTCCCHPAVRQLHQSATSSSGGGRSSSSSGGNNNNNNDAAHILLVILLIAIIIMAIIGLLVGIFLAVVIGQRIIQRHMLLLEKTRLVDDFPVKDLSGYNLHAATPSAAAAAEAAKEETSAAAATPLDHLAPVPPPAHATVPAGSTIYDAIPVPPPPPPARALRPEDAAHLRKLGLLDY